MTMTRGWPWLKDVWVQYWQFFVAILAPCVLLPIYFIPVDEDPKKFKCAYVILIMAVFWMTEAIPLAITSLLPIIFFPLLNIQATDSVCLNYMKESVAMFLAGVCMALSIQYSGLHKRIALRIMILIGTSPWRLLLGLMFTSFFLSCWIIINTAVVAMMIPIVVGLMEDFPATAMGSDKKTLIKLFMLAIGYASNMGGSAVIVGSNPNLVAKSLLSAENIGQDGKYTDINFTTWIAYGMPIAIMNFAIIYIYLGCVYIGLPDWCRRGRSNSKHHLLGPQITHESVVIKKSIQTKLTKLGRITFHESCVLGLFIFIMVLWFTNDPQIFTGWSIIFDERYVKVGDSTFALAIVLIMFIVPKELRSSKMSEAESQSRGALLDWNFIQRNVPWNIVLLVGGGFAISDGAQKSGLSNWIGEQLSGLADLSSPVILLISLLIISCLTEVLSNVACINIILPILISLSKQLNLHPLYLSLPGVIASQFAFMLPVSNPTNALIFTAGNMRIIDMVKCGAILNFACLAVLFPMNLVWGQVIFNYADYEYALPANKTLH